MKISKAFTLVELLIYMGILSVFLTVLTSIFLSALDVQLQAEAVSSVETDGRYLLSRLIYDIQRATSVTVPASAGQTTSSLTVNTGSYAIVNNHLQLTTTDTEDLNSFATSVSNFSVTRLGNPTGRPTLLLTFTVSDREESKTYQTTVSLR